MTIGMKLSAERPRIALVLTGGGARSAYQVGVLKGIAELVRRGSSCPFQIITGTSAGAVSAIALASDAAHFRRSVYAIERVWRDFRVHQVFKADPWSMLKSGMHWMLALLTGGWLMHPPHAMFDNTPLWELLRAQLDFVPGIALRTPALVFDWKGGPPARATVELHCARASLWYALKLHHVRFA